MLCSLDKTYCVFNHNFHLVTEVGWGEVGGGDPGGNGIRQSSCHNIFFFLGNPTTREETGMMMPTGMLSLRDGGLTNHN